MKSRSTITDACPETDRIGNIKASSSSKAIVSNQGAPAPDRGLLHNQLETYSLQVKSASDKLLSFPPEVRRMGNLCGRASKDNADDAFAQPGRTLGSAPAPSSNPRAPVPKIASSSGGRTLGSSGGQGDLDARQAAAKAAEVYIYPSPLPISLSLPLCPPFLLRLSLGAPPSPISPHTKIFI